MDRLGEVASLICEDAGDTWDLTPDEYKESYNKLAKQICSLFPKPDESRSDYHAIIGYNCELCKGMWHEQGDGLFEKHYDANFPPPEFVTTANTITIEECESKIKEERAKTLKEVIDWLDRNFEPTVPMTLDYMKWHNKCIEWEKAEKGESND